MKVLIVGASGMLGHMLVRHFSRKPDKYSVFCTARAALPWHCNQSLVSKIYSCNFTDGMTPFETAILDSSADVVVNCIGIIKQLKDAKNPLVSISVNSLFPHQLSMVCAKHKAKLIHISTDCVFSGKLKNNQYFESDNPDPIDLYGRTKLLGEVHESALTVRTSIIGRELSTRSGLVEWFLSQSDVVNGFYNALYSGFTTIEFANILEKIIDQNVPIEGVWQVSSDPISKYDLLSIVKNKFGLKTTINKDEYFYCNRVLNSDRFRKQFNYVPPSWEEMISKMALDQDFYSIYGEKSC